MKILISGGHLTPALALIDYFQKNDPQHEIIFVGRRFSQKKLKQPAVEKYEIDKRDIEFIYFKAMRFSRSTLLDWIFCKIPRFILSFFKANQIIRKVKPDIFISFGGYLAVPLAMAAKLNKVNILTHEGTRALGFANLFIARMADKVALSYELPTNKPIDPERVVVTGNPIRAKVLEISSTRPDWLEHEIDKPILLVMGGNQGSLIINRIIKLCLPNLLADWVVVHQYGRPNKLGDYQQEVETVLKNISTKKRSRYYLSPWVDDADLAWIYQHAAGAVSRAGANSVQELATSKIPTVFIPLAQSHLDEQLKNAQFLAKNKAGIILLEKELSAENLFKALTQLQKKQNEIKNNLKKLSLKNETAEKLHQLIIDLGNE
ncbi:MAG: UDP-N-acetylglucosamine--N-acetylmuramyl-(pentapeptide) pyrophosphoryl-undecaprenol N-acetylglucosamine transferase [Patescibacteria group bacterium]|nr:UDP-N-acetylglucosamine--N-acetylmuramyl-(pentapeptide) pyrophosphoryl-undecaprenol N-acetylglucosamine transferase [Patescibacteria group bacterium]